MKIVTSIIFYKLLDIEQLELVASQGRCFVARNRNDFIRLTVQFFNENQPHINITLVWNLIQLIFWKDRNRLRKSKNWNGRKHKI